jgi:hypothetical protein
VNRAYQPRISTLQLFAAVLALPRVNHARIIPPTRGSHPSPARIRIESNRIRYLSLDEARVLVARPTVTSAGGRLIIIAATGDFDAHGRPVMAEVKP